ncbi:MAG: hypothetical protein CL878_08230 [Dehalococcoidia bacterium]|nr:hypothetical protein [Dehalococcoidia bacterium]
MSSQAVSQVSFPGLQVTLDPPRLLARKKDYFWRPRLAMLGESQIAALVNTHADEFKTTNRADLLRSGDGGQTWSHPWPFAPSGWVIGPAPQEREVFVLPYNSTYFADSSHRALASSRVVISRQMVTTEMGAVRVTLPRQVATTNAYLRPQNRPLARFVQPVMFFWGHPVTLKDGGLVTGMFGAWADAPTFRHAITVRSDDGGCTWRYLGTVAAPAQFDCSQGGCAEPALALLADGTLLCIFRINGAQPVPDPSYGRAVSTDGGQTWSTPQLLAPAVGRVDPQLLRLSNGVLALTGGRPGFSVWFAIDGAGKNWQEVDLVAHHNGQGQFAPIITDAPSGLGTSSYSGLVEVAPNRVLIAYDRLPAGWRRLDPDTEDWNEVYTVALRVDRTL